MTTTCLPALLERSAERRPDHVAVRGPGGRELSYAELDVRANRLAHLLEAIGVGAGDRVGVYMTKSIEAVIAIHAIMKAGAAYVPLDPKSPTARVGYIARDCALTVLLSTRSQAAAWWDITREGAPLHDVVVLDDDGRLSDLVPPPGVRLLTWRDAPAAPAGEPPRREVIDQDLAYILYTSGSTGRPKGVMLTHRNALAFVDWAVEEFDVHADDVLSSHAPFHFDLSVFDLFAAAAAGATLVLVPPELSIFPAQVAQFIENAKITVWYSVPSILTALVEHADLSKLRGLRLALFAGEVFPSKYLCRLMTALPGVEFANLYGPTETNVCTFHRVLTPPDPDGPDVPIGRAVTNDEILVVDESDRPVAHGEVGELLVRGATVMRGYWNDPERTAERLVPDPRSTVVRDPLYRTGDLVRMDADRNLRFVGRRDNQVKSRGYRVELGEVETAINAHPDVVECAVVAIPDERITNRLKAFVVVHNTRPGDLASFCADRIPRYMLPDSFEFLDALPRTSTGKTDRRRLTGAVAS